MRTIFRHPGRATLEFSPQERAERLAAATPRQRTEALLFLSGYAPATLDTILDAVEPLDETADPDAADDAHPVRAGMRAAGRDIPAPGPGLAALPRPGTGRPVR